MLLHRLPVMMIISTLIIAFLTPIFARWEREFCRYLAVAVTGINFLISIYLAFEIPPGSPIIIYMGGWQSPWGIELKVDTLASIMLLLITGICFLVALYSLGILEMEIPREKTGWYYTAYLLLTAGMVGMVSTNDIFNLYVMVEIVSICACALVVVKGSKEATEATLKYLLLAAIGSGFILFAIGFLYMLTGNLNINYIAGELAMIKDIYPFVLWASLGFFVVGFGLKSALFPLHFWLPDAHSSAPFPSSVLLSSLVVKVYIIALLKIFYFVFGPKIFGQSTMPTLLLVLASMAMIIGSLFAFTQLDLKRRLAYSTVSQIGYIFLGLGLGTIWGLAAALLHIIVHAFMKACLFMTAGNIYYQTGKKNVRCFSGLGFTMPVTMIAFTVAIFSMVGIPFFGGFATKYGLALGSFEKNHYFIVVLLILSGLLNAAYFFPIAWQAFFTGGAKEKIELDNVPLTMLLPVCILAVGIILLGIFPQVPLAALKKVASGLLASS